MEVRSVRAIKPRTPPAYASTLCDDDDEPSESTEPEPLKCTPRGNNEEPPAVPPEPAIEVPTFNEVGKEMYSKKAKGRVIAVPQWLREFIADKLKGLPPRARSNVAALHTVGAQLCWWGQILSNGEPRATVGRRAPGGEFFALVNRGRLAKHCGLTRDVVTNTIERLNKLGLIATVKGGVSGRIVYWVNWDAIYVWYKAKR
jgi:hypothetical protein